MTKYEKYEMIISILVWILLSLCIALTVINTVNQSNKIKELEKSFNAPVVVTPSLDVTDEHTQDIVKQAYQFLCESEDTQPFDFGYELSYGGNDSNQMLIFITFYYSLKNDPYTHVTKLVNYYENPQEWEIVSDEFGYK